MIHVSWARCVSHHSRSIPRPPPKSSWVWFTLTCVGPSALPLLVVTITSLLSLTIIAGLLWFVFCVGRPKTHASIAIKDFYNEYTVKLGLPLKILRSDNGGEYTSKELQVWLKERGVVTQHTTPHTPQQNGVAERYNRTLVEMFRTMMIEAGAPMGYWGECALYGAWIRNRVFGRSAPEGKMQPGTSYSPRRCAVSSSA